jgi:hypothetical protein
MFRPPSPADKHHGRAVCPTPCPTGRSTPEPYRTQAVAGLTAPLGLVEAIAGMCAEIIDIEEWAQTAVASTRRENEMLAAILYAVATSDGTLFDQPNAA